MGIIEWLWSFLPDKCEIEGCKRQDVRGNENIVNGMRMCDGCHSRHMNGEKLRLRRRGSEGAEVSRKSDVTRRH